MNGNRKKKRKSRKLLFLTVFLIVFVLLSALSFGGLALSLYSENIAQSFQSTKYRYQLGLDGLDDTVLQMVTLEDMYHNGLLYISMDDVSEMCELTIVGDHTKRTYFSENNPQRSVTFYFSSDQIELNGEKKRMYGEMYEKNGEIFVPASFFEQYCTGIQIQVDDKKSKITVSRISTGVRSNILGEIEQVYQEIDFLSETSKSIENIKENSVFTAPAPTNNGGNISGTADNLPGNSTQPSNN